MVMTSDMEEDLPLGADDSSLEGVDESEGMVDEFDLGELRREFAGAGDSGPGEQESESGDAADRSESAGEEESEGPASEGEPFGSDRERYQAVISAAREHGLRFDDLEELERAESRESVEQRARGMAEQRTLYRRVEALERQLAPVQQFDSNRPAAVSSGTDETWIDRYMAGDRTARAVAAARRAFE